MSSELASQISEVVIRELDPKNTAEIELVAARMRMTLIDVLGEEKGGSMYSREWLRERVMSHLDSPKARVLLSCDEDGWINGHAIARVEKDDTGFEYGYFSTLYVEPESRGQGIASAMLRAVETWFRAMNVSKIVYNTAADNDAVLELFGRHHYRLTHMEAEMVQLTKFL